MKKKLLLIAPDFFNYHKLIVKELEECGWEVTYICDRPPVNSFFKIGIRKARFFFEGLLDIYYLKLFDKLPVFEKILIIKGEGITPKALNYLKEKKLNGKVILYYWDGQKNVPGAYKLHSLVDKVFTFDPVDAQSYGFSLLPLFYVPKERKDGELRYDWSFVGSDHSDRLQVIYKLRKQSYNINFVFIFFPSRLLYWYRVFFHFACFKFSKRELGLVSIPRDMAQEVFAKSKAVLDVHHPGQNGLTMRTLEVLSLGKKLITTNPHIKNFDFFNSQNVCVVDRRDPVVPPEFFDDAFDGSVLEGLEKYEIKNWVKGILEV